MIRVAIVEDEPAVAKNINDFLKRFGSENGKTISTAFFMSAVSFLEKYEKNFDIILMDIDLPAMDGMSAVRKLRKSDPDVLVIFITNLAQFAVNGYEVNAFDFIVKPVSYYNFALKLNRTMQKLTVGGEREIWVSTKHGKKMVKASTLKYIEVMKHVLVYHSDDGDVTGSGTLKGVLALLSDLPFVLCNQCYLVNLRYVTEIADFKVKVGDDTLQISSPKRKTFVRALNNYLGGAKV